MKKILIIEDDPVVATVYRLKLTGTGFRAEIAADGETGLQIMHTLHPDLIILDLMLPGLSGIDVIRSIRQEQAFIQTPILVFSNTYLTTLIQEAWRAGANKCLSKVGCSPDEFMELVRQLTHEGGENEGAGTADVSGLPSTSAEPDSEDFQDGLRATFTANLPRTLLELRQELQNLVKAADDWSRLKELNELYRRVHSLSGNAGLAGLTQIAQMASALEALLKEIEEKPQNLNLSSIRTIAAAVDFLAILFEYGAAPEFQQMPDASILVVDDEAISRRAIVYALEKAKLKSVNLDDPRQALEMLATHYFDLIFLDVDMPEMSGYELCAKLRALPHLAQTPVVFVTVLSDLNNRMNSKMVGGNDFITKPFLFIELTVKALIYILRARLPQLQAPAQSVQFVSPAA